MSFDLSKLSLNKFLFTKKMFTIFFLQKTYWATIMSRDNKTHILQFSVTKMHFSPALHTFLYPIILFYQNLQRFKAYQIICGKATSLSRDNKIMSRDRWNFYFELKVPLNGIDSQNFAQDPAGPIWTALYRYIYPEIYFTTTETHFCQMSRENKNGEI